MATNQMKPFLKWAGGKSQLVDQISRMYPAEFGNTITRYAEPFVGGGAILFDVMSHYQLTDIYISDLNGELINMYNMVCDRVEDIILHLQRYEKAFLPLPDADRREFYYQKREEYNELIKNGESKQGIISASLFIFLNRTCFNGLYRANRAGLFNVPMGVNRHPTICDVDSLKIASQMLKKVQIVCGDYQQCEDFVDEHTFVYFDPPYRPLKNKDSFVAYTEKEFDDNCQYELAEFMKKLSNKGAYIILSNSDPKNTDPNDNFFDELYSDFIIERIEADRRINRNAGSRKGSTTELLVRNYNDVKYPKIQQMKRFPL